MWELVQINTKKKKKNSDLESLQMLQKIVILLLNCKANFLTV